MTRNEHSHSRPGPVRELRVTGWLIIQRPLEPIFFKLFRHKAVLAPAQTAERFRRTLVYNMSSSTAQCRLRLPERPVSLETVYQIFTPTVFISSNTPSIHLSLGLPILLLPSGLQSIILLISSPLILSTFPSHLSLHILIGVTLSGDLYS